MLVILWLGLVLKGQGLLVIPWLGLVLKGQGLAGNIVAWPVSEMPSIGWYPVADLVLKGQVLAGILWRTLF